MLAILMLASMSIGGISELGYYERYDIKVFNQNAAYGVVQAVSRWGISIQTLDKVSEFKSYPTHRRLSQGMCSYRARDGHAHTTGDLRLGDFATLFLCKEGKVEYCFAISISRRPGGEVPLSRNPKPFAPYAEHQNATNRFNDTGRPFPRYLVRRAATDYPFADPEVPKEKRLKRFPKDDPFSYIEFALFLR